MTDSWIEAIKASFFAAWAGLTEHLVKKDYPRTPKTEKRHVKADRQNIRSTKNVIKEKKAVEKIETEARKNEFYMKIVDLTHIIYSDQTDRFPIISRK